MVHLNLSASSLKSADIKYLKGLAHQLNPVVTIGNNGVTAAIIEEIARALADHELIKVKIPAGSKPEREVMIQALAQATDSIAVTSIGRMCVLFRKNPEPNPKLSNLVRLGE